MCCTNRVAPLTAQCDFWTARVRQRGCSYQSSPANVTTRERAESRGGKVFAKNKHWDSGGRHEGSCSLRAMCVYREQGWREASHFSLLLLQTVTQQRDTLGLSWQHPLSKKILMTHLAFSFCAYNITTHCGTCLAVALVCELPGSTLSTFLEFGLQYQKQMLSVLQNSPLKRYIVDIER